MLRVPFLIEKATSLQGYTCKCASGFFHLKFTKHSFHPCFQLYDVLLLFLVGEGGVVCCMGLILTRPSWGFLLYSACPFWVTFPACPTCTESCGRHHCTTSTRCHHRNPVPDPGTTDNHIVDDYDHVVGIEVKITSFHRCRFKANKDTMSGTIHTLENTSTGMLEEYNFLTNFYFTCPLIWWFH